MGLRILQRACAVLLAMLASSVTSTARAQCLEWSKGFQPPGTTDTIHAFASFGDASGRALHVGGAFIGAGGSVVNRVARWDGSSWSAVGTATNATVYALLEYDAGALYAGGAFSLAGGVFAERVAKWNGSAWSSLGAGWDVATGDVRALARFDDHTGGAAALFVGGTFTLASGIANVAKWNGTSAVALGGGLNGAVHALALYDDGAGGGEALYAAGSFTTAGGASANGIAKWNGAAWSPLASGLGGGQASCLAVYDGGGGPALFVGGTFTSAGGATVHQLARWNGAVWSDVGGGIAHAAQPSVDAFSVVDVGTGPALAIGGRFTQAGAIAAENVALWNGASFSPLASGTSDRVHALSAHDDGRGPALYAGGSFANAGGLAVARAARWDGASWTALGSGASAPVRGLGVHDDGSGSSLYVGGDFTSIGGVAAAHVARFDGSAWSEVGGGADGNVHCFASFDDGGGLALYAGGGFGTIGGAAASRIAKWDGAAWSALGLGTSAAPNALAVYDDGGGAELYAAGSIAQAGGLAVNHIARWDGTGWSSMPGTNQQIRALAVYDDGNGAALYAGGYFTFAGGTQVNYVAKWDGSSWSALGSGTVGMNSLVNALFVFDDGSGEALYAGGMFTAAGGATALRIARWDGTAWTQVGAGVGGVVHALGAFDDGSGPALVAAGEFTLAGGASANRIAKWDGSTWSALGTGATDTVTALASFHDGSATGPDLYAGGLFTSMGSSASTYVAAWLGCGAPGVAYCFGDGLDAQVTADCPCANFGGPNRGCANSNSALGGAKLTATGTVSPNTIVLTCNGMPNNTLCTFLRSASSDAAGAVFGDGVRCLSGVMLRFGQQNAGQGGNPAHTASTGLATVASGATRYYQCRYRNPVAGFCDPELFNVSNGYFVAW